jgi:mRNA interferase HigB
VWVISKRRLREFWEKNPDAKGPLLAWHALARKASWTSLQDVRRSLPTADGVTLNCPRGVQISVTVFNIGGNKYRLVTRIDFKWYRVYVKAVLTHKEYDKDKWKDQLCRE